jgi:hypothetical protein
MFLLRLDTVEGLTRLCPVFRFFRVCGPRSLCYGTIEAWRNRSIEDENPYLYLDGIVLKRSWAGELRNVPRAPERTQLLAMAIARYPRSSADSYT